MLKRTRIFLIGSVAFVVLGLTVGLVAYYGGLSGIAFTRTAGPDELQYIPGDAAVVAYADVQAVMQSNFRQKIKALEPTDSEKGQQELRDALGIDIEHDITRVVACMLPGETAPGKTGLVVAAGHYDQAKIEGFIREKGGTATAYKGVDVWTHPEATNAADPAHITPAFAFLRPGVVAMGSMQAVQRAIDLSTQGGQSIADNRDMMSQIARLDSGNVWAIGRWDALADNAHLPQDVASKMPAITWFAASGNVDGGVSGTVKVVARDQEAADNLRQVAMGFMALARMQVDSKPELKGLLNTIQLGGQDTDVTMSFSLPSDILDALAAAKRLPKATTEK
jgi:hypothetical protein